MEFLKKLFRRFVPEKVKSVGHFRPYLGATSIAFECGLFRKADDTIVRGLKYEMFTRGYHIAVAEFTSDQLIEGASILYGACDLRKKTHWTWKNGPIRFRLKLNKFLPASDGKDEVVKGSFTEYSWLHFQSTSIRCYRSQILDLVVLLERLRNEEV